MQTNGISARLVVERPGANTEDGEPDGMRLWKRLADAIGLHQRQAGRRAPGAQHGRRRASSETLMPSASPSSVLGPGRSMISLALMPLVCMK